MTEAYGLDGIVWWGPQTVDLALSLLPWLALAPVVLYVLYTLFDWHELQLVVDPRVRMVLFGVAAGGGLAIVITAEPHVPWPVAAALSVLLVGLPFAFALQRQWLVPRRAARNAIAPVPPSDDELVAVLPNGRAVAVVWLERPRTVIIDRWCLVHCGLARSLSVFTSPAAARPRAWLPHRSGFWVRGPTSLWDGVDGRDKAGKPAVERQPVGLCTHAAWQAAHPDARLLRPLPFVEPRPPRKVLVKGARGVVDAMRWGVVEHDTWRPLTDADLAICPDVSDSAPPRYYLARWAARVRGLPGTDLDIPNDAANKP